MIQGRKQFAPGTPERNVIDDIPTEENTPLPGQAVITEAESNEPGFVHLLFEAPHATRFVLLHKGPTDSAYDTVYDGAAPSYDPVNVEPGVHLYKVVPYNSRGSGPASAVVTVTVAAQAAA